MKSRPGRPVLLPTSPGSLGDEALLRGAIAGLEQAGDSFIHVTCTPAKWPGLQSAKHVTLSSAFAVSPLRRAVRRAEINRFGRRHRRLTFIGADMLDGRYGRSCARWALIEDIASAGVAVDVVGFSWNASPKQSILQAIGRLPDTVSFFAREEPSALRFAEHTGRAVSSGADLAFLLEPQGDATRAAVAVRPDDGRPLVAITVNAAQLGGRLAWSASTL